MDSKLPPKLRKTVRKYQSSCFRCTSPRTWWDGSRQVRLGVLWPRARLLAISSTLLDPYWGEGPSSRQDHRNRHPVKPQRNKFHSDSPPAACRQCLEAACLVARALLPNLVSFSGNGEDISCLREVAGTGYKGEVRP